MTLEKFEKELNTLKQFFDIYCSHKHKIQKQKVGFNFIYKEKVFVFELELCDECKRNISYAIDRLKECPHENKPRCRSCKNPCYEKEYWKNLAKVMKFSGIHLGLSKLKKSFLKNIIK